jgi:hypothetical protein
MLPPFENLDEKENYAQEETSPTDEDMKSWPRIWSDAADCLRWGKAADKAGSALQNLMDSKKIFAMNTKRSPKQTATPSAVICCEHSLVSRSDAHWISQAMR